jgi:predicted GNAT family N-acyltransferase
VKEIIDAYDRADQERNEESIEVHPIKTPQELSQAHKIRHEVFVIEQKVPVEEELDEHEEDSNHCLAYCRKKPCGTARWRYTEQGIKLERFAVQKEFRGRGIGSALVNFVLEEIKNHADSAGKSLYLHAQLDAMPLYYKFGFRKTGKMFSESGIMHYKMVKKH